MGDFDVVPLDVTVVAGADASHPAKAAAASTNSVAANHTAVGRSAVNRREDKFELRSADIANRSDCSWLWAADATYPANPGPL